MRPLWEAADFVRRVRRRLRFGELSRAPLQFLRLELRGQLAECEWIARPPDPWDEGLAIEIVQRNQTFQALRDAIAMRELIFDMMTEIQTAKLRVYRPSAAAPELIITGTVTREDQPPLRMSSIVMRAKLCGLHFSLDDGVLEALPMKERNLKFATL